MDPSSQPKPLSQGHFQCSQCQRTYTRVDHLTRHVRSHLKEKPFQCQTCHKSFGRPDLLKRHAQHHEEDASGAKRQKRQINQSSRVSKACKACASVKLKCDDQKPCRRCQQRGITCEYAEENHGHPRVPNNNTMQTSSEVSEPDASNDDIPMLSFDEPVHAQMPTSSRTVQATFLPSHQVLPQEEIAHFQEHDFSEFLRGVMTPITSNPFEAYSPSNWQAANLGPRNVLDFNLNSNLDFNDADFGLLDQLYGKTFSYEPHKLQHVDDFVPQQENIPDVGRSSTSKRQVGLGTEAFKRSSLGLWLPARQDHTHADIHHVSLQGEGGSPDTRLKLDSRLLDEPLGQASRDKVLAMVLSSCGPDKAASVVTAFPQTELLDDLVQTFFAHQSSLTSSFIHIPTFRINAQVPELIAAIIAYGATLTDIKPLHKLGLAIQDAVRFTIPKRCEENNSVTRELWLLQVFMCELEIGLWSGNKRKMELSESHTQVLITMIRRAGRFQKAKRTSFVPLPQDTGDVLERKWRNWVEFESFKRIAYHAFLHDAQASMTLLANPLVSYAEMNLHLPEPEEYWIAEDAIQWKSLFLRRERDNQHQDPQPSLAGLLQQALMPSSLYEYQLTGFSNLIMLHGLWGMIWEYTQFLSLSKSAPGHNNATITLRHQNLTQALNHFRFGFSETDEAHSAETILILELLLMYLHMSLEEVQLFAGKEDQDEARRVLPSIQQWIETPNSRQAIWHALQVLRAARSTQPRQLNGFYAIALYHASLTCWAYGLISQMKGRSNNNSGLGDINSAPTAQAVWLDGPDGPEVRRFVALGRGTPSITLQPNAVTGAAELVPLSNQEITMGIFSETLRANHLTQSNGDAAPPLVENLIQLMRDLGRAAGSVGH